MEDPEPKRPPPPKSYVPLLILGDEPTPKLPPRPRIDGDASGIVPQPPSGSPVPRPRTNSIKNRSESPVPVKPERKKTKKVPPTPAPYIIPSVKEEDSVLTVKPPSPQAAPRRSPDVTDGPEPTYAPPNVLIDSLYSEVKKPKRYPAPNMPAPPPPGENGHEPESLRKSLSSRESAQPPPPSKVRPGRPPPSRPSRPPAVSPPPGISSPSNCVPSPKHAVPTPTNKPQPAKNRASRPEITVMSAQPMSGDIIPSPPMSPQYEQPSPPMTRRQIPPNRTVPDPRPPQPARPPSAPTRPSQPTRPTASVQAPPSRPPPASRPPPPQPTRKSPPAKPKPFVERKMPEEAAESPKTVPARPAARPPPPKPVSKSKKDMAAGLGPPPDEEPPELPANADKNESISSSQDTKTPSSKVETTDMTVPKETAEGDSTPVAKKRYSKFIPPTEKLQNPPDMTKTPPVVKRTPPPRPSTRATSQNKPDKKNEDASNKPSPPAERTAPEAHPRRPPPVKRPPPPKPKEIDSESKSIPNRPIKRPPIPKARSIDREVEHSEKETNDSEILEPLVKPAGRPTRPPAAALRPKSVVISEDKPNALSQEDIEPPSKKPLPATDAPIDQKEEVVNNETTKDTKDSVKSPERPAGRPSRPPTVKKPPRSKSVLMSEDKGDTNQEEILPSKTYLPSTDEPAIQKEEATINKTTQDSVKSPERPAGRPSRPPTVKKPPQPKSVLMSEDKGDTNQEEILPRKTSTDEPAIQKEEATINETIQDSVKSPERPAGRPSRPPTVKKPPQPKSVLMSEDKGDTNQEEILPRKTSTDEPAIQKEEATINETIQDSVKSPERPAGRPSRPPTLKKPPRPKSVLTNVLSLEDIQPPSKTPIITAADKPTIQNEEVETAQDSVKLPERPVGRPSRPPTMKKSPRPNSVVTSEATEPNPSSQESMNNVKAPERTLNRPSKPPSVRKPSPPETQPSDEAKKETDAQKNIVETPSEQVQQAVALQPLDDTLNKTEESKELNEEDNGAQAEKVSPKSVKRSPSVSRPPPPRARTASTAKRDKTDSSIDQPASLKKSPSISRPPPPRGRIGSTIKKDKPSIHEPTKLQKSPSISRPPPPKTKVGSTAVEGEERTVKLPPKKRPSIKRPPPPKQKSIQSMETISPEKPQLNDEDTVHVEKKPAPKRPPTISRPPPPKSSTSPSDKNTQPGEVSIPPMENTQPCEASIPPMENTQPGEVSMPSEENTQPGEASMPSDKNTQPGEVSIPPMENTQPCEASIPPMENTQPGEVSMPSEENTQPGEASMPSEEKTQPGEVSMPSETTQSGEVSKQSKQEEASQEDKEVAMKMSTTHKRPSITIPPPPKKPPVKETQPPSQNQPEDNTSSQEGSRKGSRKSPPLTRPPPPSTYSAKLKNSPPQVPKAAPDTKQSSKAEDVTNKEELTVNNAQHTAPEDPPLQQLATRDRAALPEQTATEDVSEIEVTQPVEPIAVDSELTNSTEPSGEAAVLEVQSVDQGEDTIEEPDEKRLSKESKSTSALMKPSGRRPEEEKGGIRIIRYDKKESSFDDSAVLRDKASGKPKPPRPVSMPPEKLNPSRRESLKVKPGRPPPVAEKPPAPSRPKPPPPGLKPALPTSEKPKPPRPGPPPSNRGTSPAGKVPPSKPPPAKITGGSRSSNKPRPDKDPSRPPPLPARPIPGHPLYKYVCSEPHGLATTHNEATAEDELSYMEGDVIEFIEKVDSNWYYARNADLDMHEGLVLVRNLKIIKKLPGSNMVQGFEDGPCAIAKFPFSAQSMDELSFDAGDLIMLKTRVGKDWLRGKLINGGDGIFPAKFVEIVEDLPSDAVEEPAQTSTVAQSTIDTREPHCVALHSFSADGPDELSISPGDMVLLVSREGDWLKGRVGGKEGIFPSSFVEVKVDLPPQQKQVKTNSPAPSPMVTVTATFDYDGQEGDLSFKAGEKITLLSRVNEEWVFGELAGQKGMLPVDFIDSNPDSLPPHKKEEKKQPQPPPEPQQATGKCEALFDFDGDVGSGELAFKTGDVITTTEWVNQEWIKGTTGGETGIFPINFVKVTKELPKSSKSDKTQSSSLTNKTVVTEDLMPKGVALYDYEAGNSNELSFKEGDTLYIFSRIDNEWYEGENTATGTFGQFPTNYVNVTVPLP